VVNEKFTGKEQRSSDRFPFQRRVRYRVMDGKTVLSVGDGQTINLSSTGILFTADQPLTRQHRLELSIDWPVPLEKTCRLKLVALGRVVRVVGRQVAIAIEKHELRTQGSTFSARAPDRNVPDWTEAPEAR